MKKTILKTGTRGSPLALIQVKEVQALLHEHGINLSLGPVIYKTKGDRDKKTPLGKNIDDDFFTDTIDEALLNKHINVAIHSAKDLPKQLPFGISIFALTASPDDTDAFVGKVKFKELKIRAKVGTSSLLRQQAVEALNPSLKVISVRGTIQERLKLIDDGKVNGIIVATVALKRLKLDHLIKDIMSWEPTPLQGQLAVVGRSRDLHLRNLFSAIDVRQTYGRVYLVGAGPGDPELITVKGVKILQRAECIFYDYLVDPRLLEYAPFAEKIYVGKRKGSHALPQKDLNKMLKTKAMAGKIVIRLKGGDPLIFGRGADEIDYLQSYHIDVNIIPGLSSATAIPSGSGIPLTARGLASSVAFLSAHEQREDPSSRTTIEIPGTDTLVFLMGLTKLAVIVSSLRRAKWPQHTPILIISRGTYPDEKRILGTLNDIEKKIRQTPLDPPALILVGKTLNFYKDPSRHEPALLYTGTYPEKYQRLGRIIHFPMIKIIPADITPKEINTLFENLENCDMILLTSRCAVKYFMRLLNVHNYPLAGLKDTEIISIGKETTRDIKNYGLKVSLTSDVETSRGLLKAIQTQYRLKDKKIFFPRSALPNPFLEMSLTRLGCKVDTVTVYQNIKPPDKSLPKDSIDGIIFTSPSGVQNFLSSYGRILKTWMIFSRGPLTSEALKNAGYESQELVNA